MNDQSLASVLEAAGVGTWVIRLDDNSFVCDKPYRNIFGIPEDRNVSYPDAVQFFSAADREVFMNAVRGLRAGASRLTLLLHLAGAGGQVYMSGGLSLDKNRVSGIVHAAAGTAATSGTPATGETSATNGTPAISGTPATGETSATNGTPATRGTPVSSEIPATSEISATNGTPTTIETPATHETEGYTGTAETIATAGTIATIPGIGTTATIGSAGTISTARHADKIAALAETEERFRNIIEQSPMAIGLLTGPELVLEVGNESIFNLWGKDGSATGKRLIDFLPEIKGQGFIELLEGVYNTGKPFFGNAALARLERNGVLEDAWFNFSYTPWRTNGRVTGVLVLAVEVTELIRTQQALQSSEARLRAVISGAPAAMALFTSRDLIVEMPNQAFIDIAAQGREIIGMPLREAMPELVDQPFMQLLDDVYTSGKTYEGFGVPGDIIQDGKITKHYFNFSYSPLFDAEGKVDAILDITVDVTKLVEAQRQMQEADSLMRGAVELAGLGVWSIDGLAGQLTYSERMYEWCGVDPKGGHAAGNFSQVDAQDRARVEAAIVRAFDPASDGRFDEEFTVIHEVSQRKRILHAIGKVLPDEAGRPVKIIGTAQDITVHRQVQLALEQQIQERTQELDASNAELQAANEELAVTNEELAQSNEDLFSSNEDLQQFAHVTSHDLKEPLRKMRTFLSRMVEDPGTTFSAKSTSYLERMKVSASRMSEMIEGILKYSTINSGNQLIQVVDLNAVLRDVVVDLEMIIAQKRATVTCDQLPVLQGAGILLYQLFYNLVINALKFSAEGVAPVIRINAADVVRNSVPYASIEVRDNGIGFGQENALLIFNTFTRLHTKDRYEGTGLGLALCKKIVQRHHGTILAEGRPGEGAVFIVELPFQQPKPAV